MLYYIVIAASIVLQVSIVFANDYATARQNVAASADVPLCACACACVNKSG